MEAAVGALGRAFAGEHAGRILAGAPVRIDAAGVRVVAGQVLAAEESEQIAPVPGPGRRHLRNLLVAERFAVVLDADDLVAHLVLGDLVGDRLVQRGPVAQLTDRLVAEFLQRVVVALAQDEQGAVDAAGAAVGGFPVADLVVAVAHQMRTGRGLHIAVGVPVQRLRQPRITDFAQRLVAALRLAGRLGLALDARVDAAALLGDLGQIAHPRSRDQHRGARLLERGVELGLPVAAGRGSESLSDAGRGSDAGSRVGK